MQPSHNFTSYIHLFMFQDGLRGEWRRRGTAELGLSRNFIDIFFSVIIPPTFQDVVHHRTDHQSEEPIHRITDDSSNVSSHDFLISASAMIPQLLEHDMALS